MLNVLKKSSKKILLLIVILSLLFTIAVSVASTELHISHSVGVDAWEHDLIKNAISVEIFSDFNKAVGLETRDIFLQMKKASVLGSYTMNSGSQGNISM